jgi:hypothetical protein
MGRTCHVYCSENNTGASALVLELATELKLALLQTSDGNQMESCGCMLVYLTSLTWTKGEKSAAFAVEVQEAMRRNVPLLLAHESEPQP